MRPTWEDVTARARGLATHFLSRNRLDALARLPDPARLADALRHEGVLVEEGPADPARLDLAVRRWAGRQLGVLLRWAGSRAPVLAVVFEDEDRRSIRAVLRGAVQGAPAEARLAGLIPTPSLPERALGELARQAAPAAVAALLTAWRHPFGPALLAAAKGGGEPELVALEVALNRAFAQRALREARPAGAMLELYVRETIDVENALAAVVLAAETSVAPGDLAPRAVFVAGGRVVSLRVFEEAIASGFAPAATRLLERLLGPWPPDGGLEERILRARIAAWATAARRDALSPATVILHTLRLRAQCGDLRRVIWGAALGAPAAVVAEGLVTAS